jgi:hypothetical protein
MKLKRYGIRTVISIISLVTGLFVEHSVMHQIIFFVTLV